MCVFVLILKAVSKSFAECGMKMSLVYTTICITKKMENGMVWNVPVTEFDLFRTRLGTKLRWFDADNMIAIHCHLIYINIRQMRFANLGPLEPHEHSSYTFRTSGPGRMHSQTWGGADNIWAMEHGFRVFRRPASKVACDLHTIWRLFVQV